MQKQATQSSISVDIITNMSQYERNVLHRNFHFEIMLFRNGNGGTNQIDLAKYTIRSMSLFIVSPGQVHLLNRNKNEDGVVMQFTKEYLHLITHFKTEWLFRLQMKPITLLSNSQFDVLMLIFEKILELSRSDKRFKHEMIKQYFLLFLFEMLEILNVDNRVKKVNNDALRFLYLAEKHFRENRKIYEYAQQMGISVNKLNGLVKKGLGKTPLGLIHNLLIIEIKRLLTNESLSHKEISFLLHFDSQASYTRFVKHHFNCISTDLKNDLSSH